MKLLSSFFALVMLTATQPVQAATTDPLKLIYRVSGVADNSGGAGQGWATAIHCTNFSSVTERLRFVVRNHTGATVGNATRDVLSQFTHTAATHSGLPFAVDTNLSPGVFIAQGSFNILSSSLAVHCSAMIVDAAATVPQGIALHMVRVNPAAGTQE